jgi:hypothetical protein
LRVPSRKLRSSLRQVWTRHALTAPAHSITDGLRALREMAQALDNFANAVGEVVANAVD